MSEPTAAGETDNWEAGYENLTPAQQARFDHLMSVATNTWPPELIKFVQSQPGPFCGDMLADAVGRWVKQEVSA